MATVIALIHQDEGSDYGISFPDFPGCASGGATLDEAFRRGRDTLATHVAALVEEDEELPVVRNLDALKRDPALAEDFADAVLVGAVDVELPGKSKRINVSIEERLLERIDRRAKSLGLNRSAYLAEVAKREMGC